MDKEAKRIEIITEFFHKLSFGMEQKHYKGIKLGINSFVINYVGWMKKCTMSDITRHFNINASTATRRIDKLVNLGLVKRKVDENDRRQITVSLTEKGKKIYNSIINRITNRFRNLENVFSQHELDIFFRIIIYINQQSMTSDISKNNSPSFNIKGNSEG